MKYWLSSAVVGFILCHSYIVIPMVVLGAALPARAQATRMFKARLTPVPIDVTMQATITGRGSASAALTGSSLSIDGTFEGLRSPATVARLHIGRRGVRGPAWWDLKVSNATSGTITGTVQLKDFEVDALERGSFYIQLHSEQAPDGNLWGWLMKPAVRR